MKYLILVCLFTQITYSSIETANCLFVNLQHEGIKDAEPEKEAITYSVKLTHDILAHTGAIKDVHVFHYFNPSLTVDLDKAFGLPNSSFNIQALGLYDFNKPLHYELAQGISNITGDNTFKLYQWSLQSEIQSIGMHLYLGLYDFNSEFDVRNSSALFINPSHGIGVDISQSGVAGPSIFPNPAFACKITKELGENAVLHAAVIDAVPGTVDDPYAPTIKLDATEGYLCAVECQFTGTEKEFGRGYGSLSIGGWGYTKETQAINSLVEKRNYGLYVTGEQCFNQSLFTGFSTAGFVRFGYAENQVNNISAYSGAGLLLSNDQEDAVFQQAGFSIAHGKLSPAFLDVNSGVKPFELIAELTILFKPYPILSLQPDMQFVINPVGNESNTIFGGLRVILEIN